MSENLYLTGFMGSGKSTCGRMIAGFLKAPFIDLDLLVERLNGMSIPQIFASGGEARFRKEEKDALSRVTELEGCIVALGGGSLLDRENLRRVKRSGKVVYLACEPHAVWRRIRTGSGRPLARDKQQTLDLLRSREEMYREAADLVIDTTYKLPGQVVEEVLTWSQVRRAIRGEVFSESDSVSRVVFGSGRLTELLRREFAGRRVPFVLSTPLVWSLWEHLLREAFAGEIRVHLVPDGEAAKTWEAAGRVIDWLAAEGAGRSDCLLVLGGGAAGDLGGFAASLYMRGIDVCQVPTTLLAQVDSSVGGKTAVNHARGKNLVGSFHVPRATIVDTSLLASLPERVYREGLGEVAKTYLLDGMDALEELASLREGLIARDTRVLDRVVRRCVVKKMQVVSNDLFDRGERMLLNLGHTFAHALETVSGYGQFLHGEAVSVGLVWASEVGQHLGLFSHAARVREILADLGLPTGWSGRAEDILDAMKMDKKDGRIVVPSDTGGARVLSAVQRAEMIRAVMALGDGGERCEHNGN
ncbi:MAG: bifunctional shikimate kinase/3-dehydroquinate synthase [Bacillota bacterium]